MAEGTNAAEHGGTLVEDIDLGFVPMRLASTVQREVGGESLVIDSERGTVHVLNQIGSIVWQCFDGDADLALLVDDLAEAFAAPREVVRDDVLALTRSLADVGLLAGIAQPERPTVTAPMGLEVGTALGELRLQDLDGNAVDLADHRGREVLLVNWSPYCGYCVKIAGELAELEDGLAGRDVDLVLVTTGDADTNRKLLDEHGVHAPALLRDTADDGFVDPFVGLGTPVAYLVGADGAVAAPMALGADAVPALARRAAGVDEAAAVPAGVRYLPGASEGMCGAGARAKKPRVWTGTATYRVGDHHVGVRTDSAAADDVVARMLAAHRTDDDPNVPANFSLVLGVGTTGSRQSKELALVLRANTTVVRSRSPRRALVGLVNHLAELLPDAEPTGLVVGTSCVAVVRDGEAVLLPGSLVQRLEQLQPRLARAGFQLVDVASPRVDLDTGELVVPDLPDTIDRAVIDEVDSPALGRTELPPVAPGRYPLRAWATWRSHDHDHHDDHRDHDGHDHHDDHVPTRATRVSAALMDLQAAGDELADLVDPLAQLLDRLPPLLLPATRTEQITDQLQRHLAN